MEVSCLTDFDCYLIVVATIISGGLVFSPDFASYFIVVATSMSGSFVFGPDSFLLFDCYCYHYEWRFRV